MSDIPNEYTGTSGVYRIPTEASSIQVEDQACKTVDEGLQCGDHFLLSAPKQSELFLTPRGQPKYIITYTLPDSVERQAAKIEYPMTTIPGNGWVDFHGGNFDCR